MIGAVWPLRDVIQIQTRDSDLKGGGISISLFSGNPTSQAQPFLNKVSRNGRAERVSQVSRGGVFFLGQLEIRISSLHLDVFPNVRLRIKCTAKHIEACPQNVSIQLPNVSIHCIAKRIDTLY